MVSTEKVSVIPQNRFFMNFEIERAKKGHKVYAFKFAIFRKQFYYIKYAVKRKKKS